MVVAASFFKDLSWLLNVILFLYTLFYCGNIYYKSILLYLVCADVTVLRALIISLIIHFFKIEIISTYDGVAFI